MGPLEEALREKFFPSLFGGEEITAKFWRILGHSVKHGGLDIPDPRLSAESAYNTSKEASRELVDSLLGLFVQISQQITHIQAYIRRQKRTRSYTEEDLHGIKWPIDQPTNTAADTATSSAKASADAPDDALVDAPA